ncbi:MAG: class C sortase [Bifidobacterium adolescentis]
MRRTGPRSAVAGWPYPQADDAFAAAKEYNKRLAASGQPILGEAKDPFSQSCRAARGPAESGVRRNQDSASAKDTEYQSLLDSGSGVMGTIRIPKISVKLPIYHGTSQSALASGAGHLYGSSLPVGGKDTHAVITGHRGLVEAMMFTRLDEMRVGDYFYIEVMGRTLGYQVDRISVIEPNDTSKLKIVPGEDRVTLMTCTPYGVNTHRLLVSAVRSADSRSGSRGA